MHRREMLKGMAIGGAAVAAGSALLGPIPGAVGAPGTGRPRPTPTPSVTATPTPTPGGVPLVDGSPVRVEMSESGGGKRAKARFSLTGAAANSFHGWDYLESGTRNSGVLGCQFEVLSEEYVGLALAGIVTVDVKAWLNAGSSEGYYTFRYWHGAARETGTEYIVTVTIGRGLTPTFVVLDPPSADQPG